jgi:hypothetical protein
MTQVSSKVDLSAITDFMTALKQATGSLQQFQAEVSKRLTEQGEAVAGFMDAIRTGGAGGDKSVKEQLLDKLAVPFDFNKILLDLQIDEKLSNETMAKVRQKIRSTLAATKGNPAAITGVFSELFPMLKDHSGFDGIVQQVTRGAMAFQLQPAALAKALAQAMLHGKIDAGDYQSAASMLAVMAQKAKLTPAEIEKSFPKFQLAVGGMGLDGLSSLTEFGGLAEVSKDFGGDWSRRSRLLFGFVEGLKKAKLEDGRSLSRIMSDAATTGKSPIEAAMAAILAQKDQGAALLGQVFGSGTEGRQFADYMVSKKDEFQKKRPELRNEADREIDRAAALRADNMNSSSNDFLGALGRLTSALGDSFAPVVNFISGGLGAGANALSQTIEEKPGLGVAIGGAGLLGAGFAAKKWIGRGDQGANSPPPNKDAGPLGGLLAGKLTNPLPVYVVNLPGMGFEGRGLTPVLEAFGPNRKGAGKPPGGGAVSAGLLGDVMGETRAPLSPARRGLGGLLGRVFRPLGMIDDAVSVVSAAQRGDAAGVGRGVGSGLGGMGGAMLGASLGSFIPGFGTVIGGLAGGVLGSMGGGSLLEGLMGRGGGGAGAPIQPLTPRTAPPETKANHPADDLRRLTIDLNITGLPSGVTADARSQWDKFNEAAYCGVTIRNTRSLVRI